jgi:DNA-binding response OmpR family regulator
VKVLIVEDEMMVALALEEYLIDVGYEVVDMCGNLKKGLAKAATTNADIVLLDLNLYDTHSYPIARILRDRNIPFFFTTGYRKGYPEPEFKDIVVINKPYMMAEIIATIEQLMVSA